MSQLQQPQHQQSYPQGEAANNPKKEDGSKKTAKKTTVPHHSSGKILTTAIVISILLLAVAGGYYFWITRTNNSSSVSSNVPDVSNGSETTDTNSGNADTSADTNTNAGGTPISNSIGGASEDTNTNDASTSTDTSSDQQSAVSVPDFSQSGPNYLSLDIQNINAGGVEAGLSQKADDVLKANPGTPIEFEVTDSLNKPVIFSDFVSVAGSTLPQEVLDQLGNDFSLFAYVENNAVRWGLSVSVVDASKLQTALSADESGLPAQLGILYGNASQNIPSSVIFNDSQYNGQAIRYANIQSQDGLSLDYAISGEKLVLGTSKMTLRSILDKISQEGQSE